MSRVRGSSLLETLSLEGWAMASSTAARPEDLPPTLEWQSIAEPVPVAAALRALGKWSLYDRDPRAFDGETWWYRCRLPRTGRDHRGEKRAPTRAGLDIGGLATLPDVFIDGKHVLRSENMFHRHRIDLTELFEGAGRMS